jgi:peptidoglycan/LPS O-acetylase OafA/YrhL
VLWNSIFLVPVFDKLGINDPVHPFGWTLSIEMWFYVLFGLLLLFVPGRRVPLTLIVVFVLGAVIPFVWTADWKFPYFAFHPLCWEFAMGCGAYEITRRFRVAPQRAAILLLVGIVFLSWGAATFEHLGWHGRIRMEPALSAQRAVLWGGPAFLIVIASVWLEPLLRSGRLTNFLVTLGSASYAIYLIQPLVFEILPRTLAPFGAWGWPLPAAIGVAVCVLAGCLAHRWVERPLLKWLRSFTERPRAVAAVVL